MQINGMLNLEQFFPNDCFKIRKVESNETGVDIYLKSITHSCKCPICGIETVQYHGTYTRTIQDLPIFGKNATLFITAHEYTCANDSCPAKTIVERYNGFLGYYGRYTERCEDFIEALALETSCEGASRICKEMGIQISGDTIIRILKKRFEKMEVEPTEDCIGVDDFSTKKGHKYCTIVCNGSTHAPIAVLDGRDGSSLKKWLQKNKHVKVITRDRASAYAKVINEELPDAMQIADRFHLHQNLLEAVKKALASNIPQTVKILPEDMCRNTEISPENNNNETIPDEAGKKKRVNCG